MKKTFKDLIEVINKLNFLLRQGESTKAHKKISKILGKFKPYIDTYNDKLDEIKLELASVDSKDNLILDEKGGYTYSKANYKSLNDKIKDLLNEELEIKVIEVINPQGLEKYTFLQDYLNGVEFVEEEKEEEL